MPILGLGQSKRLSRIGVLKIGEKVNDRPVKLDYFKVIAPNADEVHDVYGEKPRSVKVYLPDEPTNPAVWDANYKYYNQVGLYCKGDGEVGRYVATGREGQEFTKGELYERPCAQKGCEFPLGDKAKCRPIGILSFKIIGVTTVGIYQVSLKGLIGIEKMHSFLKQLAAVGGGSAVGIPFALTMHEQQSRFKFWVIEPEEIAETNEVIKSGKRLAQAGEAVIEEVDDYAIIDEDGELVATPQVLAGEAIGVRAQFAELLNRAINKMYIAGTTKTQYLKMLNDLPSMTEEEAAKKLDGLRAWYAEFEATKDEDVGSHASDQKLADYAFSHMVEDDWQLLGMLIPQTAMDLTRLEVRKVLDYLSLPK